MAGRRERDDRAEMSDEVAPGEGDLDYHQEPSFSTIIKESLVVGAGTGKL